MISLLVLKDPGARYRNSELRNGSSLKIGSTTINLIRIHYMIMKQELESKCTQGEIMASLAKKCHNNSKQLGAFLHHKITLEGATHTLLTFYGIPKTHIVPTKNLDLSYLVPVQSKTLLLSTSQNDSNQSSNRWQPLCMVQKTW